MNPDEFMIGALADGVDGMTLIDTLLYDAGKLVEPDHAFSEYGTVFELANGGRRGAGFPTCTWHWSTLNEAQLRALRTICPGASADVYVRVPCNDTDLYGLVWHTYQAKMLWMSGERGKQPGSRVLDIEIRFRMMVEVE